MKKLLTLFCLLSFFNTCTYAQVQSEFPKKCLHIKTTPKKANVYSTISVTTSTASISGVTVPIGFMEQTYTSNGFTNAGNASVGGAYVTGSATLTVKNDSTPVLSAIVYWGGTILYRTDAIGKHYIVGPIVGFNDLALQAGIDYVPSPTIPSYSKVYGEICITANLMTLPGISSLFRITPN